MGLKEGGEEYAPNKLKLLGRAACAIDKWELDKQGKCSWENIFVL